MVIYASLLSTTQNVSSTYLEQSTDSCIKYAIFPQGNARIAIVRRCCDGVFECNDSISHSLLWNHVNTSDKLCDHFRNGGSMHDAIDTSVSGSVLGLRLPPLATWVLPYRIGDIALLPQSKSELRIFIDKVWCICRAEHIKII